MAQAVEHILGKDEVTSSSLVSSSTKKHDIGRVFLICAKFVCTNLCDLFQKSHVEPVVCARRLRILRALIAFSCRQQLIKYRLFTTKMSCFFNAFLTHLRDLFLNRAWSLSAALDAFSCKQSLIFACRLNYPAKLHAATACRFLCAFRTPLQKLCRRVRRLRSRLPLASSSSMVYFVIGVCRRRYCLF